MNKNKIAREKSMNRRNNLNLRESGDKFEV